MYILQEQLKTLKRLITPNKVIILYGPRRCGKTTLINKFVETIKKQYLLVNGEDIAVQAYLSSRSAVKLKSFVGENKLLIIDEAQKIKDIGINLKIIVDTVKDVSVVATGSSAFDLSRFLGEPLTGRKYTLRLFPLAQLELQNYEKGFETDASLEERLVHGSYPEVVILNDNTRRQLYLKELVSSYLYKDILEMDGIRRSERLVRLLQLLAFQIGSEVSLTELGTQLGMSKNTVERYLDLLEKCFVIFRISGLSRNLRKEVSRSSRYYFYDNGIRNALINNFNSLNMRNDIGMLWENYIIAERIKKQEYRKIFANNYFWRTYDQKEIDWVEERGGKWYGYEIKWSEKRARAPKGWLESYPRSEFFVIDRENYLDFIA